MKRFNRDADIGLLMLSLCVVMVVVIVLIVARPHAQDLERRHPMLMPPPPIKIWKVAEQNFPGGWASSDRQVTVFKVQQGDTYRCYVVWEKLSGESPAAAAPGEFPCR